MTCLLYNRHNYYMTVQVAEIRVRFVYKCIGLCQYRCLKIRPALSVIRNFILYFDYLTVNIREEELEPEARY